METPDDSLPLDGVRVLELGHIVAGPSGGLVLADLGADVIKVENVDGGDLARAAMPAAFFFLNRNKRSLALDLKDDRGKAVFLQLVDSADVVLDNYSPGVIDKLGIGYAVARERNPRIIYCAVKGFTSGPYEHRPLLDDLAQMMGGLSYMTGPPGQPLRAGASVIDIGAGSYGVMGVLAALFRRQVTGEGQAIKSGLFETTAFWVGQHVSMVSLTGRKPDPMPALQKSPRGGWGVYQTFDTRDGERLFIAITSNAQWERFCREFGLEDLLTDDSLDTNLKRVQNRPKTIPRIEAVALTLTLAELCERLDEAEVPYGPLNTPYDLLDDPHLNAGHLLDVRIRDDKQLKVPALPMMSDSYSYSVRREPPSLGEHSNELLAELGMSTDAIDDLEAAGVIRCSPPLTHSRG